MKRWRANQQISLQIQNWKLWVCKKKITKAAVALSWVTRGIQVSSSVSRFYLILPLEQWGGRSSGLHWEMRQTWMKRRIWFLYLLILYSLSYHILSPASLGLLTHPLPHPQSIQDINEFVNWNRFGEIKHYITCSSMDPLTVNGCRQNDSKTADKNSTIIHTTPVHQINV